MLDLMGLPTERRTEYVEPHDLGQPTRIECIEIKGVPRKGISHTLMATILAICRT
jgi:hypothetical protein